MFLEVKRYRQRLALFVAGLLSAVLFAVAMPSEQPAVTAAIVGDRVDSSVPSLTSELQPQTNSGFAEMAASHLEPNFYQ